MLYIHYILNICYHWARICIIWKKVTIWIAPFDWASKFNRCKGRYNNNNTINNNSTVWYYTTYPPPMLLTQVKLGPGQGCWPRPTEQGSTSGGGVKLAWGCHFVPYLGSQDNWTNSWDTLLPLDLTLGTVCFDVSHPLPPTMKTSLQGKSHLAVHFRTWKNSPRLGPTEEGST